MLAQTISYIYIVTENSYGKCSEYKKPHFFEPPIIVHHKQDKKEHQSTRTLYTLSTDKNLNRIHDSNPMQTSASSLKPNQMQEECCLCVKITFNGMD